MLSIQITIINRNMMVGEYYDQNIKKIEKRKTKQNKRIWNHEYTQKYLFTNCISVQFSVSSHEL